MNSSSKTGTNPQKRLARNGKQRGGPGRRIYRKVKTFGWAVVGNASSSRKTEPWSLQQPLNQFLPQNKPPHSLLQSSSWPGSRSSCLDEEPAEWQVYSQIHAVKTQKEGWLTRPAAKSPAQRHPAMFSWFSSSFLRNFKFLNSLCILNSL